VATNDVSVEDFLQEGVENSKNKMKKGKGWKRNERVHDENKKAAFPFHKEDVQHHGRGRVRPRPEEDNEEDMRLCIKRGPFQPPSLSECLGKEGLRQLRKEEKQREEMLKMKEGGNTVKERKEATGLGVAGLLPGAR
jgi:Arc/MetJ-type ribon-helix-helix transcriptional regulator